MTSDRSGPKQWEIRAALRAMDRSREASSRRNPGEALVVAANEIVAESDNFTVKEVSDRAGVALQTFYRLFGSKDELILAMLEDLVVDSIYQLVAEAEQVEDPVERLKSLVQAPFRVSATESGLRIQHWRARERLRLSQRFPREVQASYEPYRSGVCAALQSAKSAGLIESEDPALDAMLIQQEVVSTYYMTQSQGTEYTAEQLAERVWELTWRGLAIRPADRPSRAPGDGSSRHAG